MLVSYSFSLKGRDHIKYNLPCQDYSAVESVSQSWKIAIVADGVGSCKHAEIASKIAVETVADLIKKQFPHGDADDRTYKSILLAAMNGAANAIEKFVEENDMGNDSEYHTTLVVALISRNSVYYGNAGDSGIIALDEDGEYHVLTRKQNDALGSVYAIPKFRNFEIGKANFSPVAVMCMTDGVFDVVAPETYKDQKFKVNVPFANVFSTFALGIDDDKSEELISKGQKEIEEFLQSERCNSLTDDLSVAAVIVSDSFLEPSDIPWEEPEIDYYQLKWDELSIYDHDMKVKIAEMIDYVKEKNLDWTDDQVKEFVRKYVSEDKKAKKGKKATISASDSDDKVVNTETRNIETRILENDSKKKGDRKGIVFFGMKKKKEEFPNNEDTE